MKIKSKLLLAFLIAALLGSISGIFSAVTLQDSNHQYDQALTNYGFSQGDIGKAMLMVSDINRCARDVIGFTNQTDINNAKANITEDWSKYETYCQAVQKTITSSKEEQIYSQIQTAQAAYESKLEEVTALGDTVDSVQSARAQRMAVDELDPLYQNFYNAWASLMSENTTIGDNLSDELLTKGNHATIFVIVMIVLAVVLSIALGFMLAKLIAAPLALGMERLQKLAKGDVSSPVPQAISSDESGQILASVGTAVDCLKRVIHDIDFLLGEMAKGNLNVDSRDEAAYIGDLAHVLESIRGVLNSTNDAMSQIDVSADQVKAGSEQVSSSAQALAQGATEQASSVEELAATISEISQHISRTAAEAQAAKDANLNANEQINLCNTHMNSLIQAMNVITEKSSEVSKVIHTIEDIAFQTNILALNAAVEAARAGKAGKGFAVVADEVRNLATKSQEAAKSTTSLIEETVRAVEEGSHTSAETEQSLKQVVTSAQAVLDAVINISNATDEQVSAVNQVTQGIDQISSVVQTNSATAEQSAAASEELSGQANLLKELVDGFQLRGRAKH